VKVTAVLKGGFLIRFFVTLNDCYFVQRIAREVVGGGQADDACPYDDDVALLLVLKR
jgi:hypothetical protein